jgi:hypothetical protein
MAWADEWMRRWRESNDANEIHIAEQSRDQMRCHALFSSLGPFTAM